MGSSVEQTVSQKIMSRFNGPTQVDFFMCMNIDLDEQLQGAYSFAYLDQLIS